MPMVDVTEGPLFFMPSDPGFERCGGGEDAAGGGAHL